MKLNRYWNIAFIGGILLFFVFFQTAIARTQENSVSLPQTGQTISYANGDDGALQRGTEWPDPRFTDNNDGTVTDNLTKFICLKDAGCLGSMNWLDAINACNKLADGQCGLNDGSVPGDWFLPNIRELHSLIDFSSAPPPGAPFKNWWKIFFGLDRNWHLYVTFF